LKPWIGCCCGVIGLFLCVDNKENLENDFHFQSCNVTLLCHIEIHSSKQMWDEGSLFIMLICKSRHVVYVLKLSTVLFCLILNILLQNILSKWTYSTIFEDRVHISCTVICESEWKGIQIPTMHAFLFLYPAN
jgi:hypothetical protein